VIDLLCPTTTDTRATAGRLAALCRPGDVILLCGPLGSGKTAFTSGLADGLGVEEPVTSPTFVVMRRYESGFLPLVHVDVYRLGSAGEFEDLDALDEGRDGVIVIEWGEAVAGLVPDDRLTVWIGVEPDGARRIGLQPSGVWTTRRLQDVVRKGPGS
jgi:tRNA threonylcarbamoyladenosine biosynthesis protein TsaE